MVDQHYLTYVTTEETVKDITKINQNLQKKIDDLEIKLNKGSKESEPTLEEVKRFSVWKFLK